MWFHNVFPEEAVNEVKRQAVSELQKAVAAAEQKANEMVNAERAKLDRAVLEARRLAAEEAVSLLNNQDDSSEVSKDLHFVSSWFDTFLVHIPVFPTSSFFLFLSFSSFTGANLNFLKGMNCH